MTLAQSLPGAGRPRPLGLLPTLVAALLAALLTPLLGPVGSARADQEDPAGVPVHLRVTATTEPGDTVLVTGSTAELGAWDPTRAVPLSTDARSYPAWNATLVLPPGGQLQYKYLKRTAAGAVAWEDIPDRSFFVSTSGESELDDRWNVAGGHPLTAVFAATATTVPGQNVYVIGDLAELGGWDPAKAVPLSTSYKVYPEWTGFTALPPNTAVQYKYLKKDPDGGVVWEDGPNRTTTTPPTGTLTVHDSWR
ncbi:CBM20 domain-containing protein [Kitasatospora sp. NPDC051914]|uniref:CBM20 domain-containing protein n=1 Tax=Kitasatospora sp. NPDC051914 TaxID=3154945 RepID=UPI00343810B9